MVKEGIQAFDQWLRATIGGRKRENPRAWAVFRSEVGIHIGPPKGVDRLLRIADQHQRVVWRIEEDFFKNAELCAIGVLRLVDKGKPESLPNSFS